MTNRQLISRIKGRQRGFTLIELIVSMAAGLLISAAAFLLARNASAFFQHEARMTTAQFSSIVGMTRLTNDIRRAAFMSTANVDEDPRLCGDASAWPVGMQQMAGVRVEENGSAVRHPLHHVLSALNSLTPDALIITGMTDTTEQFAVDVIQDTGGGSKTVLLQNDGAMFRTAQRATQGGAAIDQIFAAGRYIRLVDQEGRFGYGIIDSVNTGGAKVQITVRANPILPTRDTEDVCGCQGFCTGSIVNPVSRVLYDLRNVDTVRYTQYAGLNARSGYVGDLTYHKGLTSNGVGQRTELVRVEIGDNGVEIDSSLEILAELAVDMKFGATIEDTTTTGNVPAIERLPIGDADVYANGGALGGVNAGTPHQIRALQVRFSVRASHSDREVGAPMAASDGGLLRYNMGVDRGFARMRTLIADVQLLNQQRDFGIQ